MTGGFRADATGMSRAEKRAALLAIQANACAVCGAATPNRADHDHATGLLRGMLCASCNVLEGKTRSGFYRQIGDDVLARFSAYRANPPAGRIWLWDFPDDWSQADTDACRRSGLTVVDYVLTVRPTAPGPTAAVIAMGHQRQWTEPA